MTVSFSQLGNLGRLANSCFQAACTISHALDHNDSYLFPASWKYRHDFPIPQTCFVDSIKPTQIFKEAAYTYAPIPVPNPNGIQDLVGYYQSWRYFESNEDVIKALLTPKNGFGIQYNTCSLHVRRSDYLNLTKEYHQLTLDNYYREAMKLIGAKKYLIISDDIPWCKTQFQGEQFSFSDGSDPITDLKLQIACEHGIIANSSYSWFGAYLKKCPNKQIIAPKKWFETALNHDIKDLIPPSWIQI